MSNVVFTVKSDSTGELYQLEASRTARGVRFTCSCQAGQNAQHCKHRIALLLDDAKACVEVEDGAVARLADLVRGSDLMARIQEMQEAERAVADAQADLKRAKKAVARAMAG